SRRRHTRFSRDWSSDVCSSDLLKLVQEPLINVSQLPDTIDRVSLVQGVGDGEHALIVGVPELVINNWIRLLGSKSDQRGVDGARSEERRVGKECRSGRAR